MIVLGVGIVFTAIFHIGTKEKSSRSISLRGTMMVENTPARYQMRWKDWVKEYQFFQVRVQRRQMLYNTTFDVLQIVKIVENLSS